MFSIHFTSTQRIKNPIFCTQHDLHKQHLSLTPAGKIYVENAKKIQEIQKVTYAQLGELKDGARGDIFLGTTQAHGIDLFTAIFPLFHEKFSHINLHIQERYVAHQETLLKEEKLDLGLVLLKKEDEQEDLEYLPIFTEKLILGLPKTHLLAPQGVPLRQSLPTIDLKLLEYDYFALMFANSTMRHIIEKEFEAANFTPQILIETSLNHVLIKLASSVCCSIISYSLALHNPLHDQISWFEISPNLCWNFCLAKRRDAYLSGANTYFIHLAQEYGQKIQQEMPYQYKIMYKCEIYPFICSYSYRIL